MSITSDHDSATCKIKNRMNEILLVSSSFTPEAVVASMRFSFLVEEFEKLGIRTFVIASDFRKCIRKDYSIPQCSNVTRVRMIPEWPVVARTVYEKIKYRIWIKIAPIDGASGWILPAIIKGVTIAKNNHIRLILATAPPASSLIVGYAIAKVTGARYILDYRDPWNSLQMNKESKQKSRLQQIVEKFILERAYHIVACTSTIKESLIEAFRLDETKISVITNGFSTAAVKPAIIDSTAFTITYAGNFYGERNIGMLAESIVKLRGKYNDQKPIRIHVYGNILDSDLDHYERNGLTDSIVVHKKCEYCEVIRSLKGSDVLFLPSGIDHYYALPFKLFDYLRVQRPILAVTAIDSELWKFMNTYQVGVTANIADKRSIYSAMEQLYLGKVKAEWSDTAKYSWCNLGNDYVEIIKNM